MATNSTSPCYMWGGKEAQRVFTPCNLSAAYSMCCRTVQPDAGLRAPDTCLPNGLCAWWNMNLADLPSQEFFIQSCTDPTWKDPACASLVKYVDSTSGSGCFRDENGNVPLGFCPDANTYCCNQGVQNTSCCDTSTKGNIAVRLPIASMVAVTTSFNGDSYTTALPTLLTTSSSTNSVTAAVSPLATGPGKSKGLSVGAGAGIGVGATIGAFAVGLAVFYALSYIRRRPRESKFDGAQTHREYNSEPPIKSQPDAMTLETGMGRRGPHELS